MKYAITIGVLLAASQCPTTPPGEEKQDEKQEEKIETEEKVDAGAESEPESEPDAGRTDTGDPSIWLEPGPEPFDVPTRRIELPGLDASLRVPAGTDAEKTPLGVTVKLSQGKNFWIEVTDAAVDLDEVRELQESETAELLDRWEDAVVWNEQDRWYFQYSGALSCSNPLKARHDLDDIELMIAACRTIETTSGEPPPTPSPAPGEGEATGSESE